MPLYRDEGVVLRVQKLGEADRIVTVLTRTHGRVRAVAKGVRRTRSKFGASVEPFSHVDLQLWEGTGGLDIVTPGRQPDRRTAATSSATTAATPPATAVLETAERLTAEEREPSLRLFLLVVGALRALVGGGRRRAARDPGLVLDAFLLRAMTVRGLRARARGLRPLRRARAAPRLLRPAGGHGLPGLPPGRRRRRPAPAALGARWSTCSRATGSRRRPASRATRREASGLVAAHLQWHLERGLRSLPLVERT